MGAARFGMRALIPGRGAAIAAMVHKRNQSMFISQSAAQDQIVSSGRRPEFTLAQSRADSFSESNFKQWEKDNTQVLHNYFKSNPNALQDKDLVLKLMYVIENSSDNNFSNIVRSDLNKLRQAQDIFSRDRSNLNATNLINARKNASALIDGIFSNK